MQEWATKRVRIHVSGQVQGVGFRPYAYRLARSLGLCGYVVNDPAGATIEVQGRAESLEAFAGRLAAELPPLAIIRKMQREELPAVDGEEGFAIRASAGGELADAQVTVDTAACADCLRELGDAADPRHRYPFINCTNCGPRYSIVERIPYDRANTTMSDFAMCELCASQYRDPADRRFHAQPVACPACGPTCRLVDPRGKEIACADPIAAAAEEIRRGRIVAVKGLGGFHLACRADDDNVVRRLRMRKRRDAKPFALMVRDLAQGGRLCLIDGAGEELLSGPQRPIVLLPRRDDAPVAESVATGLPTLGIMLPYTPLHALLLGFDLPPLVMTSGNISDEPLVKDNADAVAHLGSIADAILLHDRRIQRSIDDSVAQADERPDCRQAGGREPVLIRRARGYAPQPVTVGNAPSPVILAVGAELKNAVCLYRDGRGVLSEHIGDLKDGRVYRHFIRVINDLEALFDLRPEVIAADLHPQYLSTEYALRRAAGELAGRAGVPLVRVQHHHAHIVACLAEHGRGDEVIGLSCDGTGYGQDGAVWGCEVMRAGLGGFVRLGHLRYFPLPGGDAAARRTARPAAGLLAETFGPEWVSLPAAGRLRGKGDDLEAIAEQLAAGVNCPAGSSLGRFFDGVAAICGVAPANRYDAEAPMLLEGAAAEGVEDAYPFKLTDGEPFEIDYRPMVEALAADLRGRSDVAAVAARFHNTVASMLAEAARRARQMTALETAALSGGCLANRYLRRRLTGLLQADGFEVLTHSRIPCNDGGVSLGQAVSAAARLADGPTRDEGN